MKTLVTHIKPHLDDICGMWLYKKYVPGWRRARTVFIGMNARGGDPYGGKSVDTDPNSVHVGVCRGKYDEHKGNVGESAATLVWKDLRRRKLLPREKLMSEALHRMVDFVLEGDLGKRLGNVCSPYEIGPLLLWIADSDERVATGAVLLDALLRFFFDRVTLDHDWKKRKEFKTPWGKGVGLVCTAKVTDRAYEEGFVLAVHVDTKTGFKSIRADAHSTVDLTRAYEEVKKREPKAGWYFHHSKRLLICGDVVAPRSRLSKLSLGELIGLVRA